MVTKKDFKVVENARGFMEHYKDGEEMAVGFQMFDKDAYESVKTWLEKRGAAFVDCGYENGEDNEFIPQVIVLTDNNDDMDIIFDNINDAEPCRICVTNSRLMTRV